MSERTVFEGTTYYRYPEAKEWRRRMYFWNARGKSLHRAIWESNNGSIPTGMHIHHQNHNPLDNRLDNLVCVDGRAHVLEHAADRQPRESTCERCGKAYSSTTVGRMRFCSNACRAGARRDAGVDNVTRQCERCGADFETSRFKRVRFCSKSCSSRSRGHSTT